MATKKSLLDIAESSNPSVRGSKAGALSTYEERLELALAFVAHEIDGKQIASALRQRGYGKQVESAFQNMLGQVLLGAARKGLVKITRVK